MISKIRDRQLHARRQDHSVIGDPGWTDFNNPDPGITILELLGYTLIAAAGATAFARWRKRRNAHHLDTTS